MEEYPADAALQEADLALLQLKRARQEVCRGWRWVRRGVEAGSEASSLPKLSAEEQEASSGREDWGSLSEAVQRRSRQREGRSEQCTVGRTQREAGVRTRATSPGAEQAGPPPCMWRPLKFQEQFTRLLCGAQRVGAGRPGPVRVQWERASQVPGAVGCGWEVWQRTGGWPPGASAVQTTSVWIRTGLAWSPRWQHSVPGP